MEYREHTKLNLNNAQGKNDKQMKIKKSDYLGFMLSTSAKDLKDMLTQTCTFGQANYYVDTASVHAAKMQRPCSSSYVC